MKRAEPGQVRVHRGFMRAGGSWELWPVEEGVARALGCKEKQRISALLPQASKR